MAQETSEVRGDDEAQGPRETGLAGETAVARRTRAGLWTLSGAVAPGVAGDALFRVWPLGINVLLWTLAVAAAAAGLAVTTGRWSSATGGWLLLPALLFANPDELIARTNAARGEVSRPAEPPSESQRSTPTRGVVNRRVDAQYLASLSADAVPTLVEALPSMPEPKRRVIAQHLLRAWKPPEQGGWRSWSLARTRAWEIVGSRSAMIVEAAR